MAYEKSRFTDSQIAAILEQAEAGTPVADLCRDYGISSASFYQWMSKYGGIDASLMRRLKELEAANARLKKMYAEERIKVELRLEALEGTVLQLQERRISISGTGLIPTARKSRVSIAQMSVAKRPVILFWGLAINISKI